MLVVSFSFFTHLNVVGPRGRFIGALFAGFFAHYYSSYCLVCFSLFSGVMVSWGHMGSSCQRTSAIIKIFGKDVNISGYLRQGHLVHHHIVHFHSYFESI